MNSRAKIKNLSSSSFVGASGTSADLALDKIPEKTKKTSMKKPSRATSGLYKPIKNTAQTP